MPAGKLQITHLLGTEVWRWKKNVFLLFPRPDWKWVNWMMRWWRMGQEVRRMKENQDFCLAWDCKIRFFTRDNLHFTKLLLKKHFNQLRKLRRTIRAASLLALPCSPLLYLQLLSRYGFLCLSCSWYCFSLHRSSLAHLISWPSWTIKPSFVKPFLPFLSGPSWNNCFGDEEEGFENRSSLLTQHFPCEKKTLREQKNFFTARIAFYQPTFWYAFTRARSNSLIAKHNRLSWSRSSFIWGNACEAFVEALD